MSPLGWIEQLILVGLLVVLIVVGAVAILRRLVTRSDQQEDRRD